MEILRYIGGKVSKQAFRINIGTSVRHDHELDVDTTAFCFGIDFGDTEAIHLSRLLAGNNTLRTIRLRIQPKLTVRGAEVLAKAIVRSSITKLNLFGTVRTTRGQLVVPLGQHSRDHLGPNRFAEGHPIWEFANPQVIQTLLLGICQSSTIQELIISYYATYPPGYLASSNMEAIAVFLQSNHSIKRLNLGFNLMRDEDVDILVQYWRQDTPLREILLKLNRIGANGAVQLLRATTVMPSSSSTPSPSSSSSSLLQKVDLSFNFDIGYGGLQRIAQELLPHLRLRELKLGNCVPLWVHHQSHVQHWHAQQESLLNEQAAIHQNMIARDAAARALIEGIRQNVYLHTLDVRNNHFSEQLLEEIDFYCELNKKGRYFLTMEEDNAGVAPGVWCHVLAKCSDDINFCYYVLREQPTLVRPSTPTTVAKTNAAPRREKSEALSVLPGANHNKATRKDVTISTRQAARRHRGIIAI